MVKKNFEIGHCIHEIWQFYWECHIGDVRLVKVDFGKKALKIWESVQSIGILAIQRSILTQKHCFCTKSFK